MIILTKTLVRQCLLSLVDLKSPVKRFDSILSKVGELRENGLGPAEVKWTAMKGSKSVHKVYGPPPSASSDSLPIFRLLPSLVDGPLGRKHNSIENIGM